MLPDSLFSEPGLPEPARRVRGFWPAVTASVLLHVAVGIALARLAPPPSPPAQDLGDTSVVIRIATRDPQRRVAAVAHTTAAEQENAAANVPAADPAPAESTPSETAPTETPAALDAEETPAQDSSIALDLATLQNSISNQIQVYRRDVLNQDMQECRQYRERYDRWDCPQGEDIKSATQELIEESVDATFRAYTYGHDANARISRELLADMDAMRPLLEDAGVLGALARERYYSRQEQYLYLNPGGGRSDMIVLASITPSGIVVLNGLLTLSFMNGKVVVLDKSPAKPFDEDEE